MGRVKRQNQLHPQLPKKERVDEVGNDRRGAYFKSGNTTTLLCRGLTSNGVKVLANTINDMCNKLGTTLEGYVIDAPAKQKTKKK